MGQPWMPFTSSSGRSDVKDKMEHPRHSHMPSNGPMDYGL
jgi:hypothetical protein